MCIPVPPVPSLLSISAGLTAPWAPSSERAVKSEKAPGILGSLSIDSDLVKLARTTGMASNYFWTLSKALRCTGLNSLDSGKVAPLPSLPASRTRTNTNIHTTKTSKGDWLIRICRNSNRHFGPLKSSKVSFRTSRAKITLERNRTVNFPRKHKRLWYCVGNQLINHTDLHRYLTIILFLRISRQAIHFFQWHRRHLWWRCEGVRWFRRCVNTKFWALQVMSL